MKSYINTVKFTLQSNVILLHICHCASHIPRCFTYLTVFQIYQGTSCFTHVTVFHICHRVLHMSQCFTCVTVSCMSQCFTHVTMFHICHCFIYVIMFYICHCVSHISQSFTYIKVFHTCHCISHISHLPFHISHLPLTTMIFTATSDIIHKCKFNCLYMCAYIYTYVRAKQWRYKKLKLVCHILKDYLDNNWKIQVCHIWDSKQPSCVYNIKATITRVTRPPATYYRCAETGPVRSSQKPACGT